MGKLGLLANMPRFRNFKDLDSSRIMAYKDVAVSRLFGKAAFVFHRTSRGLRHKAHLTASRLILGFQCSFGTEHASVNGVCAPNAFGKVGKLLHSHSTCN